MTEQIRANSGEGRKLALELDTTFSEVCDRRDEIVAKLADGLGVSTSEISVLGIFATTNED